MNGVRTTQEQLSTHPGMDDVRTTQEQLSAHPGMDGVRTTQEQLSTHPGMDGVRTTQEQLSTKPLGEALNAPKLIKKCSNGLKSAVAAFSFLRFWSDISNIMLQISSCYRPFFLRLNTHSTTESRLKFNRRYSFQHYNASISFRFW